MGECRIEGLQTSERRWEMEKAIKTQRSMDKKVEDFEDEEMQIRKMGTRREG